MTEQLTCQVPHADQLRSLSFDYNGHGTQLEDVAITLGVAFLVVMFFVAWTYIYWRANGRRWFKERNV